MGSRRDDPPLYLRGNIWWTVARGPNGDRVWRSTHQRSREAALVCARQIRLDVAAGRADRPEAPPVTLRFALGRLTEQDALQNRAAGTRELHTTKGRHLLRVLGRDLDLRQIARKLLDDYLAQRLDEGVTRHTVKKELGVLRQAVRVVELPWDPRLMPDLQGAYVPRERWLPIPEYRALLAALAPSKRDYVIAWCHTGVRKSELFAIRAADIDPVNKRLWVRGTKTEHAPRWVPLSADALVALQRAAPFRPWGNLLRDLRAACRRAGIAAVTPNDLRRTCCSWMATHGVPMKHAAAVLGHSSTAMVERVYGRLAPEVLHGAVATFPAFEPASEAPQEPVTGAVTDSADLARSSDDCRPPSGPSF